MKSVFSLIFLSLLILLSWAQEPGMKNYTVYDGLPSDEVYRGILASDGYMWFCTDNGVSRFDGETFTNYGIAEGLTENTILDVIEDDDGRIWFVGISGKLSYYEKGIIYKFEANNIITENKTNVDIPSSGLVIPINKHEIQMSFFSGKTIHIKNKTLKKYELSKDDSVSISLPSERYRFYIDRFSADSMRYVVIFDSIPYSVQIRNNGIWGHNTNHHLYIEYDDKVIYFNQKTAITIFRNGEFKITVLDFYPMFAIKSVETGIWIGTYKNGLYYYPDDSFDKNKEIHLLQDQFVTSLMYDQNNRGWVTTSYGGVFNIQSLYITNYYKPGQHPENFTNNIVQLNAETFIYFARNNKVFLSYNFTQPMEELTLDELNDNIVYQAKLHDSSVFAATNEGIIEIPLSFFLKPSHPKKGVKVYRFNTIKDFLFQDSILWIASSRGLYYETEFLSRRHFNPQTAFKSRRRITKTIAYPSDINDSVYSYFLVQDLDKLLRVRYKAKVIGDLQINAQTFHSKKNTIAKNDILVRETDKYIFMATKGGGIRIIADDSLVILNTNSNLLSNIINVIKMPYDTILLAGTNKGLNILKLSDEKYPRVLMSKFITTKDGLKGNEIHDIACNKNHVLLATNMGTSLVNIFDVVKMKDSFPILITNFIVNGEKRIVDTSQCIELTHLENNIQIEFNAIDFHDKTNMSYYYRLLGAEKDDWLKINKAGVIYPELTHGSYTFQVKAKNSYGYSSENIASMSFHIQQVFYNSILFRLFIAILFFSIILGYLYLLYLRKTDNLRNKNIFDDYQQKSLMRVMNPHFIFNALNSVNSFIVTNRKKDATMYVSQIASLIRQIFNSATNNTITIDEEMDFLNAYLKLEQRRLKNSFLYVINADDEIKNIHIPSFMIQVFVENSVWHGLPLKIEKGALISVIFKKQGKYVLCEITDNGIGRIAASKIKKEKSNKREKHGIDVIQQRIYLINKRYNTEKISLRIEDRLDKNHENALGTIVKIRFPNV